MATGFNSIGGDARGFFRRARLDQLLEKSLTRPIVLVTAGAGCGKSSVVQNFLRASSMRVGWIGLSEADNDPEMFWQNFICSICGDNADMLVSLTNKGLPANISAFNAFLDTLSGEIIKNSRYVIVFDNYHLVYDNSVLWFVRMLVNKLSPDGVDGAQIKRNIIILSREESGFDNDIMAGGNRFARISEDELRFSQSETLEFFRFLGVSTSPELMSGLPSIYENTGGWAFLTNIAGQLLKKRPDGVRYIQTALKHNMAVIIENELHLEDSQEINKFLIKLSLLDHLSADLIAELDNGSKLIRAVTRCSSLVHYDAFMNEYQMHHFLREYLLERQHLLSEDEQRGIYMISAEWYLRHNYNMDAAKYYFKAKDYKSVIDITDTFPFIIPINEAATLFDLLNTGDSDAGEYDHAINILRSRLMLCMGQSAKAVEAAQQAIGTLEGNPEKAENKQLLLKAYYIVGLSHMMTCHESGSYDFAQYYQKADDYYEGSGYMQTGPARVDVLGAYINEVGQGGIGELEQYIGALTESVPYVSRSFNGCMSGRDDLAMAELAYFQGDAAQCKQYAMGALYKAQERQQYDIENRALFFLIRLGMASGNYQMIKDAIAKMSAQLDIPDFVDRYIRYDLQTGWFYSGIGQKDRVAEWLKSGFTVNYAPTVISNLEDSTRCRYYLNEQDYHTMLAMINSRTGNLDIRRYLFGKIELEAHRAVCLLNLDDVPGAVDALRAAYKLAAPNKLDMFFIQMGNHMRTMAATILKVKGCGMPAEWLENIQKKSATYAKRTSQVKSQFMLAEGIEDNINLTPKELELLRDLSHGLSRNEIADERSISINTVKMTLQYIYEKLGAENSMDAVRIAFFKGIL